MNTKETIDNRENIHGSFEQRSRVAQQLIDVMVSAKGWAFLSFSQKQALTEIAGKISRVLHGDANHPDHWHDIAGYAELVHGSLPKPSPALPAAIPWCSCCGVMQPPHMIHCAEGLRLIGSHLNPTHPVCAKCSERHPQFEPCVKAEL